MSRPVGSHLTSQQKLRYGILAVGFAASVAVGSITGAMLKTDKQKEEAIRTFRETSPEIQVAMLESQRDELLKQRATIQRKIDLFKDRVEERKEEKAKLAAARGNDTR